VKSVSHLSCRFRVVFDDDKTVPNAGLVIPLRLADRLGFRDAVNRRVRGRSQRRRPNSGDKALAIVAMLTAGGEFISDVDVLAAGSTLSRLGYRWFSQSRLGEWLRSLDDADIDGFADAMTEITNTAWTAGMGPDLDAVSAADPLVVDLDSTFTETHGAHKDGTTRRNYQGMHGYYPLLAVEASTGDVIAAMLREGNAATSGVGGFTADTLNRVRRLAGDDTALLLRADSGFYLRRLFDLVDRYAFVTDQTGDPETLWRRHNHRAVIETTIRDLKHGPGLNHYPSGSFTANAAWLHLNTLAHNLLRATNRLITPTPMVAKTLRYRYSPSQDASPPDHAPPPSTSPPPGPDNTTSSTQSPPSNTSTPHRNGGFRLRERKRAGNRLDFLGRVFGS
jgi:hypothetical protein